MCGSCLYNPVLRSELRAGLRAWSKERERKGIGKDREDAGSLQRTSIDPSLGERDAVGTGVEEDVLILY